MCPSYQHQGHKLTPGHLLDLLVSLGGPWGMPEGWGLQGSQGV